MRLLCAVVAATAFAAACSSFSATEDGNDREDASGDALSPDTAGPEFDSAPLDSTAKDAGADVVVLLVNGDFEQSTTTCAPGWSAHNANAEPIVDGGHAGQSCRLCASTPTRNPFIESSSVTPALVGTYSLAFWAKLESAGAAGYIQSEFDYHLTDGGLQQSILAHTVKHDQWVRLTQDFVLTAVPQDLFVDLIGKTDGCVIFDDVTLTYSPP